MAASLLVLLWELTWGGELGPLVRGQLENVEGRLDDLDPVLHAGFLERADGVTRLELVSEHSNENTTFESVLRVSEEVVDPIVRDVLLIGRQTWRQIWDSTGGQLTTRDTSYNTSPAP